MAEEMLFQDPFSRLTGRTAQEYNKGKNNKADISCQKYMPPVVVILSLEIMS